MDDIGRDSKSAAARLSDGVAPPSHGLTLFAMPSAWAESVQGNGGGQPPSALTRAALWFGGAPPALQPCGLLASPRRPPREESPRCVMPSSSSLRIAVAPGGRALDSFSACSSWQ
jgi:hypothetical protein